MIDTTTPPQNLDLDEGRVRWVSQTEMRRQENQFGYCRDIVQDLPQSFDRRFGKVLISEEAGLRLGLLILSNLRVNVVLMTGDKKPRVDQVGRSEYGERT